MMKKKLLRALQLSVAKSKLLTKLAMKLRNQCNLIISAHYSNKEFLPDINGEYLILDALMSHCSTYFDVGANKGEWTTHIIKNVTKSVTLYLYEPGKMAYAILSERFNDAKNIHLNNLALSDYIGAIQFYEEDNAGEMSSALKKWIPGNFTVIEAKTTTIDAELSKLQLNTLDYLKIDTEGFDLNVLRGTAEALTTQKIKFIQFEYNSAWGMSGSTLLAAYELFERCGYKVFLIKNDGLHYYDVRKHGDYYSYSNYIAVNQLYLSVIERMIKN